MKALLDFPLIDMSVIAAAYQQIAQLPASLLLTITITWEKQLPFIIGPILSTSIYDLHNWRLIIDSVGYERKFLELERVLKK